MSENASIGQIKRDRNRQREKERERMCTQLKSLLN